MRIVIDGEDTMVPVVKKTLTGGLEVSFGNFVIEYKDVTDAEWAAVQVLKGLGWHVDDLVTGRAAGVAVKGDGQ